MCAARRRSAEFSVFRYNMDISLKNMLLPFAPVAANRIRILVAVQAALALALWFSLGQGGLPTPPEVAHAWLDLARNQGLLFELWESVKALLLALVLASVLSVAIVAAATA